MEPDSSSKFDSKKKNFWKKFGIFGWTWFSQAKSVPSHDKYISKTSQVHVWTDFGQSLYKFLIYFKILI